MTTESPAERIVAEVFSHLREVARRSGEAAWALDLGQPSLAALRPDAEKIRGGCEKLQQLTEKEHETLGTAMHGAGLNEAELSRMRHDLRAQVGAIKGYAELVLEELAEDVHHADPDADDALGRIVDQTRDVLESIQRLQLEDLVAGPGDSARPRSDRPPSTWPMAGAEGAPEQRFAGRTVLLIDDSDANRELLARRLGRTGLDLVSVARGQDGLAVVGQRPVDVILCDIMMPEMDGYEVLRRLKADEATRDIPVLMLSAVSDVDSVVRCLEAGADDYLTTPFNPTVLHARIKGCLDKKILADLDRQHLAQLEQAREELEMAIESMEDGFAVFDLDRRLLRWNANFARLNPYVAQLSEKERTFEGLLRAAYDAGSFFVERRIGGKTVPPGEQFDDWIALRRARFALAQQDVVRMRDGRWIEVGHHRTPSGGTVCVHKDITQRKRDEERLTYLALHDPLTGLANRAQFDASLEAAFAASAEGGEDDGFALLYLDLDGFKAVNDTLGHDAGDQLLVKVAQTLADQVRTEDLVSRLGGDEFAVLMTGVRRRGAIEGLAGRILTSIGTRFEAKGKTVPFGASIGVAMFPGDGEDLERFLAHADVAMYAAKNAGKGRTVFYADLGES